MVAGCPSSWSRIAPIDHGPPRTGARGREMPGPRDPGHTGGRRPSRNRMVAFQPGPALTCNLEVAYVQERRDQHRPHREEGPAPGTAGPGLARPDRTGPVRGLVRGEDASRLLRARENGARGHHPPGLRAPDPGDHHREDGAGAPLLLALAPRRGGPAAALLEGPHDPG